MDLLATSLMSVQSLGHWGYWIVFLLAFLESLAFIGGAVPGMTIIAFFGFLTTRGYLNLDILIVVAAIGAILGDSVSYYLGVKGKKFFKNENRFLKESHLDKSQAFFLRHGNKSIFLARFIGLIRPMIPFAAGLSRMDYRKFLFWNISSGIIWAIATLWLGRLLGSAFRLIEVWSTRFAIGIILSLAIIVLFWFLAKSTRPLIGYLGGVLSIAKKYILTRKFVLDFSINHPQSFAYFVARFDKNNFFGWPLTIFSFSLFFLIIIFIALADGVLDYSSIWYFDERIISFLKFFRDVWMIKFAIFITMFANWITVIAFFVLVSLGLWIWNRRPLIWPLFFSLVGSESVAYLIKHMINRPRPGGNFAFYLETTPSFPSGHATVAMAMYGFAFYLWARFASTKKYFVGIVFSGFLLIFAIGFSRLYLGVHYFSDVSGGYLIGAIFLLMAIGFSEWQIRRKQDIHNSNNFSIKTKKIFTTILVVLFIAVIGYGINSFRPMPIVSEEPVSELVNQDLALLDIFKLHNLPFYSVGLTGGTHENISFAIWAKSSEDIVSALNKSGWNQADEPTPHSLLHLSRAVLLDTGYAKAPIAPLFWNNQANSLAFEKPITKKTVRARHRVRIWQTNLVSVTGYHLFVGTANFDYKVYLGIIHRSDPNLDKERELFWEDLNKNNVLIKYKIEELLSTITPKNIDDYFITDGNAYNLFLK